MSEGFLFDSDNPRQVGRGVDALRVDGDGLKANWKWTRGRGAMEPDTNRRCKGQTSEADLRGGFGLEVVFWHTNYEALVTLHGEMLVSRTPGSDWGEDCGDPLVTRASAQAYAEALALEFLESVRLATAVLVSPPSRSQPHD